MGFVISYDNLLEQKVTDKTKTIIIVLRMIEQKLRGMFHY